MTPNRPEEALEELVEARTRMVRERKELIARRDELNERIYALGEQIKQAVDADMDDYDGLTPKQLAVVRLRSTGMKHEDIGRELDMSQETAKTHLKRALERVGVHTSIELAVVAHQRGWI
jgi:DNA-binding NarL/FixJ family response regulator